MKKLKPLTWALIITGIFVAVLGVTLYLTIPQEIKAGIADWTYGFHRGMWNRELAQGGLMQGPRAFATRNNGIGGFLFVLFIVFIPLVVFAVRRRHMRGMFMRAHMEESQCSADPLDRLRTLYAEGSITTEEYERRKAVLEEDSEHKGAKL